MSTVLEKPRHSAIRLMPKLWKLRLSIERLSKAITPDEEPTVEPPQTDTRHVG